MGLKNLHKRIINEIKLKSHDKKLVPLFVIAFILLRLAPDDAVSSMVQSAIFQDLIRLNPLALKMANFGSHRLYSLYCYGISSLLVPYLAHVLYHSPDLRAGVSSRFRKGGRQALAISAITCIIFSVLVYYMGDLSASNTTSRVTIFVFYSKNGITIMSVCLTYFLTLMATYFVLCSKAFVENEA